MALLGGTSGEKTSQAEWFAADVTTAAMGSQSGVAEISFQITSAVAISYTLDSGTTWLGFNANNAIPADTVYKERIFFNGGTQFNIRKAAADDVTVTFCEVNYPWMS